MPTNSPDYWSKNGWANYKKYQGSKKAKKQRASRNTARNRAMASWKVKKWDWKEIDHKKPLSSWWTNAASNLRVISRKKNRQLGAAIANRKKKV